MWLYAYSTRITLHEFCEFIEFPFRLRKMTLSRFRLKNSVLRPIHTTRKQTKAQTIKEQVKKIKKKINGKHERKFLLPCSLPFGLNTPLGCEQTERQRQRQGPIHCVYGDAPKWIWDRLGASSRASP